MNMRYRLNTLGLPDPEDAGVLTYRRVRLTRSSSLQWLFVVLSLPGVAALMVPFVTGISPLYVFAGSLKHDRAMLLLAVCFFLILPIIVWRIRIALSPPSAFELRLAFTAAMLCVCLALITAVSIVLATFRRQAIDDDDALSICLWLICLVITLAGGQWIGRRAARRISPAAGILSWMLTAYLAGLEFLLVGAMSGRLLGFSAEANAGYYLTMVTACAFVAELIFLALGQWPPRIRRTIRETETK